MEVETNFPHHLIEALSNSQIEHVLMLCWSELEKRFQESSLQDKNKIESVALFSYAKIFTTITKIQGKSLNPLQYTPFRANLLAIHETIENNHISNGDEEENENLMSFQP